MEQHDIFVSYSREDTDKVSPFADFLRNKGYDIWIDHDSNYNGEAFANKIVTAIRSSKLVIFFSSQASNVSKWVKRELSFADEEGKHILPVRLDSANYDDQIKLLLAGVDYCDASSAKAKSNALENVYKSVVALIGEPITTPQEGPNGVSSSNANPLLEKFYKDRAFRNGMKSEALVFTVACTIVWELLQSFGIIYSRAITQPILIMLDIILGIAAAFYATHLTTSSRIIPGWYNRHLTSYGALIIAMDFIILLLFHSIFALFGQYRLAAICVLVISLLALIAMGLMFRNKLSGYRLLWGAAIGYAASVFCVGHDRHYIVIAIVVLAILVLFIAILKYTLKLRINGISAWMLMHGKTRPNHSRQYSSGVEKFLMSIWGRIY